MLVTHSPFTYTCREKKERGWRTGLYPAQVINVCEECAVIVRISILYAILRRPPQRSPPSSQFPGLADHQGFSLSVWSSLSPQMKPSKRFSILPISPSIHSIIPVLSRQGLPFWFGKRQKGSEEVVTDLKHMLVFTSSSALQTSQPERSFTCRQPIH